MADDRRVCRLTLLVLGVVAGCGGVDPSDLDAGSACVEAADEQLCAQDVTVTETDDRVQITGEVVATDVELGFERAPLSMTWERGDAGWSLVEAELPLVVTCEIDIAHGDHCHLGIPSRRACSVSVAGGDVDRSSSEGDVLASARVVADVSAPDCCTHTCAESTRTPTALPAGPYRMELGVRASLP